MSTILFYCILFSHTKLLGLEASEYSTLAGLFLWYFYAAFSELDIPNLLLLSSYEKEQQR